MSSLTTLTNPFHGSIVGDPWQPPEIDVSTIHQTAFTRCCEAIAGVRANGRTTSVLVHGEAGSGKTHLLARLRAHIARQAEADGPGGLQEAVFIAVCLQTGPQMIWRHLRLQFVDDLLRGAEQSQLERLLLHRLAAAGLITGDPRLWLARRRQEARGNNEPCRELEKLCQQMGHFSPNLYTALGHLLLDRHSFMAGAWLRGDSLPVSALNRLDLAEEDEEPEEQSRQIVLGLSRLADANRPIIFCFDQLEALQVNARDTTGLFSFGQMVTELHRDTKHALIISCIQLMFTDTLKNAMPPANYARLREFTSVVLKHLDWNEAAQLIEARLNSLPLLTAQRAQSGEKLWPLSEEQIKPVVVPGLCTARQLLNRCKDMFEEWRSRNGEVTIVHPQPVKQFLDQTWDECKRKARVENTPKATAQTGAVISLGLPLLANLIHPDWQRVAPDNSNLDVVFQAPAGRVGVGICNNDTRGGGLANKLNRLGTQLAQRRVDKLILVRDSRLPIGKGAGVTRAALDQVIKQGASWGRPTAEAFAVLNALRRLLSDAKSGALANGGETIFAQAVEEFLQANWAEELNQTFREFLPDLNGQAEPDLAGSLLRLLQNHRVVSVAHAAALLRQDDTAIAACAQRCVDRLGVLGEPPVTLFHLVGEAL